MTRSRKLIVHLLIVLVVAASAASEVAAQEKDIEKTFTSLGYKVSWDVATAGADWELRDFNMRLKHIYAIRSLKKVPGEKNLYYRFFIRVEEFATEAEAEKRMEHIASTPPGSESKLIGPEYDLREGFRRGKLVYVVSADVYKFVIDKSLSKLRAQLESEIKE